MIAQRLNRTGIVVLFSGLVSMATAAEVRAEGHFQPGVANVRDMVLPGPGIYVENFTVFYGASVFRSGTGDPVDRLPGTRGVDVDTDLFVFSWMPMFVWVTGQKLLGADFAISIAPSFGNTHVSAALSGAKAGVEVDSGQFHVGDLFLNPAWLGWHWKHFDLSINYGLTVPVGKYDADDVDNIGLGYWSHQFQLGTYYYPWVDQSSAVSLLATFETNGQQRGTRRTPGQNAAIEWGISQYFTGQFEVGVSGYHLFQVSDDDGGLVERLAGREQVHAVGGQLSYWVLKDKLYLSIRYMKEFAARSRFEGHLGAFNVFWVI
jgi:hypothetical protein